VEKQKHITYSECVCLALVIRHALRMRLTILSSVASMAVPYFSTLSRNQKDFREKSTEHKICFDVLYKFCLKYSIFSVECSEEP
jgi:hypothetical protein